MPFRMLFLSPQDEVRRDWAARLRQDVPGIDLVVAEDEAQAAAAIPSADAALGRLTPALLARAERLRWLQVPQIAPPADYFFPELVRHPLTATNMREIFNDHIGAQVMAYILAFARDLDHYMRRQARREWAPKPLDSGVMHLPDATLLIVGLGGIGLETARLAAAFGMTVLATDARRAGTAPHVAELHGPEALDGLLSRADFVVLTVPHTPATEGFMDRARFRRMKPGAFFINIGRGPTTKLDDLVAALDAGEIAGAALDVFETEPLPPDHRLWTMDRVILTPHTAGYGPFLDERRYAILRDNARAFAEGRPLINVVDKANRF